MAQDDKAELLREAKALRQRRQDRDDLNVEQSGQSNGRLRRFVKDPDDPRTPEGKDRKRADQLVMRTAAEMARWDAQMVTVGGVQMTNAEERAARLRFFQDPERYTRWARERGLIRPGEEQDLVRTMQRIHDLKERDRLHGLDDDERHTLQELEDSRLGRIAGQVRAHIHEAHRDMGVSVGPQVKQADSSIGAHADGTQRDQARDARVNYAAPGTPDAREIFSTAPLLDRAFTAAKAATAPLDVKPALTDDRQVAIVTRTPAVTPGVDL